MKTNGKLHSVALVLAFIILLVSLVPSTAMAAAGQWGIIRVEFDASPTTGDAPLEVHFYDRTTFESGGKIVNRYWNFGDGTDLMWDGKGPSSFTRNPTHTYRAPGKYKVELIEGVIFKEGNYNDDVTTKIIEVY